MRKSSRRAKKQRFSSTEGTALLGLAGKIADIAKNVKSAKQTDELREVQQKLLELQQDFARILEENERLKREAKERERLDEIAADLEFRTEHGFYVRKSEQGHSVVIPYCPRCWDKERKLVHLREGASRGVYGCLVDGSSYWTADYRRRLAEDAAPPIRRWRRSP
jgi:cob(I)alamin adenosyltransferase